MRVCVAVYVVFVWLWYWLGVRQSPAVYCVTVVQFRLEWVHIDVPMYITDIPARRERRRKLDTSFIPNANIHTLSQDRDQSAPNWLDSVDADSASCECIRLDALLVGLCKSLRRHVPVEGRDRDRVRVRVRGDRWSPYTMPERPIECNRRCQYIEFEYH